MKKGAKIAIAVVCGIIAVGAIGTAFGNSGSTTVKKGGASSSDAEVSKSSGNKSSESESASGGKVTATLGDVVKTKELSFELNNAFTAKKIESSSNEFLKNTADDGKVYLVLELTADNISDEKQNISSYFFHASVDDYSVDETLLISDPDGLKNLSGTVMPGKKLKGYLAYEIDENWKNCEIAYTELLKDEPTFTILLDHSKIKSR